ncbi:MAG: hypothetical protein CR993_07305 [Rhodobacterales bacterium]|nr:MAG: hypothetical protein CR993_07305 [Rhodobacterales bacterium]
MPRFTRRFVKFLIAAALLWSLVWFIAAQGTNFVIDKWLDARRAENWAASYTDLTTRGYPFRLDTTVTDLELSDPATQVALSSERLDLLSKFYMPHHRTASFSGPLLLASPKGTVIIEAEQLTSSMKMSLENGFPLTDSTTEITDAIISGSGWRMGLASGLVAMRANSIVTEENVFDQHVALNSLQLGDGMLTDLRQSGGLPTVIKSAVIDLQSRYDRPFDLRTLEERRPQPIWINLRKVALEWGELRFDIRGYLDVDQRGQPTGSLDLTLTQWRAALDLAVATGAIPMEYLTVAQQALELIAMASDDPNTLETRVTFEDGRIYLGPFPIGDAPDLRVP